MQSRTIVVFAALGALLLACGGSVAQDLGSSGSSGSSSGSSGASSSSSSSGSSGSSSSSSSSSSSGGSSSSSSSSGSTSGSSGGTCVDGSLGDLCPWNCPYGPRARCVNGAWSCPRPTPTCDICTDPVPDCKCGNVTCDTLTQKWTCGTCADAGGPFQCGSLTCVAGQICTDMPPGVILPDGGAPPDSLNCAVLPDPCRFDPTCACVMTALKGSGTCEPTSCTSDGAGHLTVGCLGF